MFFKNGKGHEEAKQALQEAEVHVQAAKQRSGEVAEISAALREARKRNHFAEQISALMGKKA